MSDRKNHHIAQLAQEHIREMQDLLGDDLGAAKEAFLKLITWVPEYIENERVSKILTKAYHENGAAKGELPPILCNLSMFTLLGKGESRTFTALLGSLAEGLGISDKDMRQASRDRDEEEAPRPTKHDVFSSDEFDALEMTIRETLVREYGDSERHRGQRALRAIKAAREVLSSPRDPDWNYLRVKVQDLQIGDELVERGRWVQVLGFFHDEPDKRYTDKGMKFSEVPVPSKEIGQYTKKPKYFWVKTSDRPSGDKMENHFDEECRIRRRKTPEELRYTTIMARGVRCRVLIQETPEKAA